MQWNNGADKATDLFGSGKHGFKDGNPGTGEAASVLASAVMNDLLSNVAHAVQGAGVALTPGRKEDLYDAIAGLASANKFQLPEIAKAANFTAAANEDAKLFVVNTSAGAVVATLTAAATVGNGKVFVFRREGNNALTIDANAAELIDGAATITVSNQETVWLQCNGTAWRVIARNTGGLSQTIADIPLHYFTPGVSNFVKTGNWRYLIVEVGGAGGGGGGARISNGGAGAGGGAGGYAIKLIDVSAIAIGATIAVMTVAPDSAAGVNGDAAGTGTTDGAPGGTTSFGAYVSATGGNGGLGDASGGVTKPWTAGGVGVGGDVNRGGQSGASGVGAYNGAPGVGGTGPYGLSGGNGGSVDRSPTPGFRGFIVVHPFY